MKKYKVSFYLGLYQTSRFETPFEIVYVEAAPGTPELEIVRLAQQKLGKYPRSHHTKVKEIVL